ERRQFLAILRTAVDQIPEVKRARIGKTISLVQVPENNIGRKAYSFAAVFDFETASDLQRYLEHAGHQPVREAFWRNCSATLIADVEIGDVQSDSAELLV